MANYKSAIKRTRSDNRKRLENRYKHKTTKTFIKKMLNTAAKEEAAKALPKAYSMLDKLVQDKIIHANRAAQKKSKLAKKFARVK
ncbi:MAG: 30S ribosomal protein S20 [Cytophagales bacterium]